MLYTNQDAECFVPVGERVVSPQGVQAEEQQHADLLFMWSFPREKQDVHQIRPAVTSSATLCHFLCPLSSFFLPLYLSLTPFDSFSLSLSVFSVSLVGF